jgi:hypothetical protein
MAGEVGIDERDIEIRVFDELLRLVERSGGPDDIAPGFP